jgi:hypothetical protein
MNASICRYVPLVPWEASPAFCEALDSTEFHKEWEYQEEEAVRKAVELMLKKREQRRAAAAEKRRFQ